MASAKKKAKPKIHFRAPDAVWVSWCATCGWPLLADVTDEMAKRATCNVCPVGKGRVRVAVYDLRPGSPREA